MEPAHLDRWIHTLTRVVLTSLRKIEYNFGAARALRLGFSDDNGTAR